MLGHARRQARRHPTHYDNPFQIIHFVAAHEGVFSPPLLALGLCCSSKDNPLSDPSLRPAVAAVPASKSGVKVTFLGNSTLHLDDGETSLLVDGFLSRPGVLQTIFGRLGPDREIIRAELTAAGITRVDAVLVGHAHHDHALDATAIADAFDAEVVGSRSFAQIYRGSHDPEKPGKLTVIPPEGDTRPFGRFTVTFAPSAHVAPDSTIQRLIAGEIKAPLRLPTHCVNFKCGDVFALHFAHPEGNIVVTTTAGAKPGQLKGKTANLIFLGVGYLSKEAPEKQRMYWRETVEETNPEVVIPVHWDNFTRKLSKGLRPSALAGNPREIIEFMKVNAGHRTLRVLDVREAVCVSAGRVY